jgi:outer membrane protein TolC
MTLQDFLMLKKLILLISVVLSLSALLPTAHALIRLDEAFLARALKENPPSIAEIETTLLKAQLNLSSAKDQFDTNLSAGGSYYKTDEQPFAVFIPVSSPIKTMQVGVTKNLESGLRVGVRGFNEQVTNNFINKGTTTGLSINAGIDLWKDLVKRRSQSRITNAEKSYEIAKLQTHIARKTFLNSLRKIYWSLVANEEALNLSNKLLASSQKQVKQAERRFKNKVADSGEVARYRSQYSSRLASITTLKYQKASLMRSLKELLPHLALEDLDLAPYNIQTITLTVLACTVKIASELAPPEKNTFYDEIIAAIKEQDKIEQQSNSSYSSPEVILNSEVGIKGRAFGYGQSTDDLVDNRYKNYAIGLQINIPIDGRKKTTEEILQKVTKLKNKANQERQMGRVKAYHTETVKQIMLLKEIIRNQKNNTKFLKQSLKSSKKKYNQARLTVEQLVTEQDAYLQSNLDEIQTNLTTVSTLLDYLSVYTETPCQLNRI